jgi:hypothetical protein
MPDFLYQVAIRLAVMLPTLMIIAALVWYAGKSLGAVRTDVPFEGGNMRTWPLPFALIDAALFALTFAIIIVAMGESDWSAGIAGGASAVVAIGIGPRLLARFMR